MKSIDRRHLESSVHAMRSMLIAHGWKMIADVPDDEISFTGHLNEVDPVAI
jgi:hypothetical protein